MAVSVRSAGEQQLAYWSVDFIVRPEHRGLGVGSALKAELERRHAVLLAFGSSPTAQHIHRKRSWTCPTEVSEHYYQLRGRGPKQLAKKALQALRREPTECGNYAARVAPVADVLRTAGDLWEQHAGEYQYAVCRDSEYLEWKYVDHPLARYEAIQVVDRAGLVHAVGIVRVSGQMSRLVDYVGPRHNETAKSALVRRLLLHSQGSSVAHCTTTDEELARVLRSHGFRNHPQPSTLFGFRGKGVSLQGEDWFLTTGDSDGDLLDAAADCAA
jgi:GNAT superfamily N-acetyltransferase